MFFQMPVAILASGKPWPAHRRAQPPPQRGIATRSACPGSNPTNESLRSVIPLPRNNSVTQLADADTHIGKKQQISHGQFA